MKSRKYYVFGALFIIVGLAIFIGPLVSSNVVFTSPGESADSTAESYFSVVLGIVTVLIGVFLVILGVKERNQIKEGLDDLEKKLKRREKKEGKEKPEKDGS